MDSSAAVNKVPTLSDREIREITLGSRPEAIIVLAPLLAATLAA
jgi:hypothetical protein